MQSSTPSQTNDLGIHLSTGVVNAVPRGQRASSSLHGEVSMLRIRVVENRCKGLCTLEINVGLYSKRAIGVYIHTPIHINIGICICICILCM